MKRFYSLFLVFAVLMGSLTCIADSTAEGFDIEDDGYDLVIEEIEEPVDEIELILGEDMLEEVELVGEEDSLLELTEGDTDLLPYMGSATADNQSEEESEFNSSEEVMANEAANGPVTQPVGNGFYWPMETHTKSSGFMPLRNGRHGTGHLALDIYSDNRDFTKKIGSSVYPIYDGWVIEPNGYEDGAGKYVRLKHNINGIEFYSQYQHLHHCESLTTGQYVHGGQTKIGTEGGTGGDYSPHLHIIVWSMDSAHPWACNYELKDYKFEDPDTHEKIEYHATESGGKYAALPGFIDENGEYIKHPYYYVEWYWQNNPSNTRYKVKLFNPWDILNGRYVPGDERKKVETISLNKNSVNLNFNKGETFQLVATVLPEDAANRSVIWSTDKPEVATVTEGGLVQPVGAGNAVITCKAQDGSGASASCTIKVTKLELNAKELDMYIGQTYTLKGTIGETKVSCSFKSSNSKVVSVDKKGKITAKNVKKTTKVTITATAPKKQGTATCIVTVHPKPTKLAIKQGKAKTLNIGDTLDLTTVFTPKDALGKVIWSTSHKKVATVSSSGKVKAVGEGVTTIEAEVTGAGDGSATIKITVVDPKKPTGIKISAPSKTVYMGETLKLTTTLSPKTAESTITWKSSNNKIAKVSKKGVVTPVKAGTATITATASKKSPKGKVVKAKIKITVKKSTAPSSISVGTAEKTLHVGDQWQLDYEIKPAGAKASLTFNSSDETVATVNEKGIITANATGSASITVVTQNNKKASCKVTVLAEASGLQLDKESLSLNVGDTYQLTCFVSHGLSGSVTFSSSNAAVATVDANALITAVGVGEATITASMDNGAIATCEVTVVESEEEHPVVGDFVIDNGIVVGYTGEGGDVVIPSKDSEGNPVVGIDDAFEFNSTITGVTIPNTMTSIGFRDFYYCSSLTKVVIPSSVTSIEESAFSMCKNLTNVTIPDSVTTIGEGAFYGCNRLRTINLPSHLTRIEGSVFGGCAISSISIPSSVTYVGWGAFYGCSNLTSIVLPSELTYLGGNAFNGCSSLKSVNIPYGVTRIYDSTFEWCESLQNIIIPDSVTIIDEHAFSKCYSMTSIIIPYSIKSIGIGAFWNSYDLVVTVPSNGIDIGIDAFRNCKQVIYV